MRYFAFLAIGCAVAFASCGSGSGDSATTGSTTAAAPAAKAAPSSSLSDTATTELLNLVNSYYNLKDALVASDAAKTDAAAGKLMADAEGFKQVLANQASAATLQPQLDIIESGSETIVNTNADSLEAKRAHFLKVSDAMYALLKGANLKNGGVYQQYCPMAFNDQGGHWLSAESDIMNPYLPKKMLHCGEVKDSL